jgi:hypothetical protein
MHISVFLQLRKLCDGRSKRRNLKKIREEQTLFVGMLQTRTTKAEFSYKNVHILSKKAGTGTFFSPFLLSFFLSFF